MANYIFYHANSSVTGKELKKVLGIEVAQRARAQDQIRLYAGEHVQICVLMQPVQF